MKGIISVQAGESLRDGWLILDPWAYCNEVQYNKGSECTAYYYYIATMHCYSILLVAFIVTTSYCMHGVYSVGTTV